MWFGGEHPPSAVIIIICSKKCGQSMMMRILSVSSIGVESISLVSLSPEENQSSLSTASVARYCERMGGTPKATSEGPPNVPNNGLLGNDDASGEDPQVILGRELGD